MGVDRQRAADVQNRLKDKMDGYGGTASYELTQAFKVAQDLSGMFGHFEKLMGEVSDPHHRAAMMRQARLRLLTLEQHFDTVCRKYHQCKGLAEVIDELNLAATGEAVSQLESERRQRQIWSAIVERTKQ